MDRLITRRSFVALFFSAILCAAGSDAAERINHAGRILEPVQTVAAPTLFNTAQADTIVSSMQIFPTTSPWNEDISQRTLLPNSAAIIAQITSDLASNRRTLRMFTEMNYVLVPDNQPTVPITMFNYPDESDDVNQATGIGSYPIPTVMPVETWPAATGALTNAQWQQDINSAGGDRHSIIVMPGTGYIWETWQTRMVTANTPQWEASNGAKFPLNTNVPRPAGWTSGDAAGLPMFPALVRYDECERGIIEHAMRIVVAKSRREYIYPATHFASSIPATSTSYPAMGQRVRLNSGFVIPANWTKQEKAVATALKKYGAIVADNGGFFSISICPDNRYPAGCFDNLSSVAISNFEVISTTGATEGPRSAGAPTANASADQTVSLAGGATLTGSATGTGLTTSWYLYPYTAAPGTVTFGNAANLTTSVTFSAVGTYTLMLRASDSTHTPAYDAVIVTVSTSGASVAFNAASSSAAETMSSVNFPVTLSGTATQAVTVSYAATGGSATGGGTDYTLASGTLNFAIGETAKTITVNLTNDNVIEGSETVVISLSSPVNAGLGAGASHTLTITDKPTPVVTWANPADITVPTVLGATQLNATASVAGSFIYTPAAGTALNAGAARMLSVQFTPADTTAFNTPPVKSVNVNVLPAPVVPPLPPAISSGPTVNVSPIVAGTPVPISCAADQTATWTWDFGDGTILTNAAASVTHTYAAPGHFVITVKATNAQGAFSAATVAIDVVGGGGVIPPPEPPGPTVDSDGDGVLDAAEILLGTNPLDPNSKPGGTADFDQDGTPDDQDSDTDGDGVSNANEAASGTNSYLATSLKKLPVTIKKLKLAATFSTPDKDTCSLSGIIPALPKGFDPAGKPVRLDVGGAVLNVTLNEKGKAKTTQGSIALTLKRKKNPATKVKEFIGGDVPFKATFMRGPWAENWIDEGVDPASGNSGAPMGVTVDLSLNGNVYTATAQTLYKAKAGKSGKAKTK